MALPQSKLISRLRQLRSCLRPWPARDRPAVACAADLSIARRLLYPTTLEQAEQLHQAADRICAAVATCPTQPAQRFMLSCLINHHPLLNGDYGDYSMPVNQIETLFNPLAKDLVDLTGGMSPQLILQAAQLQLVGAGLARLEKDSSNVQCLQLQVDRLQQQDEAANALVQVCQNTSSMLLAGKCATSGPFEWDDLPLQEGLAQELSADRPLFKAACDVLLPANNTDYLVQMKRQAAVFIAATAAQVDNANGATAFVKWAFLAHRLSLLQVYRKVREPGMPQWALPVFEADPLFVADVENSSASKTAREQGARLALYWEGWADALRDIAEQQHAGGVCFKRSVRYNAEFGSPVQTEECNIKAGRGTPLTQLLARLRKQLKS